MWGLFILRVYLAGPLFTVAERSHCLEVKSLLESNGFDVLWPWELTDQESADGSSEMNLEIFRKNLDAIDDSDLLVVILDGPDVDSGTAWEIGYAYSKNKQIYGIRTDFRLSGENSNSIVNLMISQSTPKIARSLGELEGLLKAELPKISNN